MDEILLGGPVTHLNPDSKQDCFDMIAMVRGKLACRPAGSLIRKYFPMTRLEDIEKKIARGDAKDFDWSYWQPFFRFLKDASEVAIRTLDDDLQVVLGKAPKRANQICQFLKDETVNDSLWLAEVFTICLSRVTV